MTQNYDFLRSFTIDGKETKHLFQIAKLNIPFLSKENEFFQVGNTDGKHFRNTKLGEYTLSIDGFIIKDNTGKTVPQVMDELKALVNSDEPQKLVFDIFPDRYFNAIFTGAEEYDATDLKYTPLTLTFDVPDGLAHQLEPNTFTNVYATGTNLVLDSEFNNMNKYLTSWVVKLDEKYNDSNIIRADFTNGYPVGVVERNDQWLYQTPRSGRRIGDLKQGDSVSFSVYVRVNAVDGINKYAGSVVLDEYTDGKKNGISHFVRIPNTVNTTFVNYGEVVQIVGEKTNGIGLQLGAYGLGVQIDFTKPMMSLLPPLAEKIVEPVVGATMYSNSLDFGDYDYSGNPNLFVNKLKSSDFIKGNHGSLTDDNGILHFTSDGTGDIGMLTSSNMPSVGSGKTYTLSAKVRFDEGTTGDINKLRLTYCKSPGGSVLLEANNTSMIIDDVGKEITIKSTASVAYEITNLDRFFIGVSFSQNGKINGGFKLYDIKIEEGPTATPYQPNLLDAPYYLSKVALGENIANKTIKYPIKTSAYAVYTGPNTEPYIAGQKYTLTMKATKPATQTFNVFLDAGTIGVGSMTPVDGLTDVWQKTFTVSQSNIDAGVKDRLTIYQVPNSSVGAVQIDWLKIEKGDTRTPNIDFYKYRGLHSYPSTNPTEYSWEYDPSYYRAINYVPSEYGVGDVIRIKNSGTYRSNPTISFVMNGENGLVGLLNENGSILQFGNPEDVDGTTSYRVEQGLDENFWGNTLTPTLQLNTGFKSVYPNMNNNPTTPNLVQGTWDMRADPDAATPVFTGVGPIHVWHGPSIVANIQAPSNTDRTLPISNHYRFVFDNYNKGQRGRIEFATFDENGNPIMTAIIRDSSNTANELVFEAWYKNQKLHQQTLDRKIFWNTFYEMNMDRRGNQLIWRMVQIKKLGIAAGGWSNASIDKEYKFTWTLPEPDTSKFTKSGAWVMRYSKEYHVIMRLTDIQARWEGTPYYQDLTNYFQDGDLVEIDTATREFFVNGAINNQLNVVGNQWEGFTINPGDTIIQPIVSSWANMPDVFVEFREKYL